MERTAGLDSERPSPSKVASDDEEPGEENTDIENASLPKYADSSNNESQPKRVKRKRRVYSEQERRDAAMVRKIGACEVCRRRKIRCRHGSISQHNEITAHTLPAGSKQGSAHVTHGSSQIYPLLNQVSQIPSNDREHHSGAHRINEPASRLSDSVTTHFGDTSRYPLYAPEIPLVNSVSRERYLPLIQKPHITLAPLIGRGKRDEQLTDRRATTIAEGPSPLSGSGESLDRQQFLTGFESFSKALQEAADAAFSPEHSTKYSSVHVLMLRWEEQDEKCSECSIAQEFHELARVFTEQYGFEVDRNCIPTQGPSRWIGRKMVDFIDGPTGASTALKIVYYCGHSFMTQPSGPMWSSHPRERFGEHVVTMQAVHSILEESSCDALLIMDACVPGFVKRSFGSGTTEVIASRGFNTGIVPLRYSFTHSLITELSSLSSKPAFSVSELYNRLYCRMQSQGLADEKITQAPPLHFVTTSPTLPRSIVLSPFRKSSVRSIISETRYGTSKSPLQRARQDLDSEGVSGGLTNRPTVASPIHMTSTTCPQIALSIKLSESMSASDLSADLFADWLRSIPALATEVRIEAGFYSN